MDSDNQDCTIDAEVKDPVTEEVVDVSDTVCEDGAANNKDAESIKATTRNSDRSDTKKTTGYSTSGAGRNIEELSSEELGATYELPVSEEFHPTEKLHIGTLDVDEVDPDLGEELEGSYSLAICEGEEESDSSELDSVKVSGDTESLTYISNDGDTYECGDASKKKIADNFSFISKTDLKGEDEESNEEISGITTNDEEDQLANSSPNTHTIVTAKESLDVQDLGAETDKETRNKNVLLLLLLLLLAIVSALGLWFGLGGKGSEKEAVAPITANTSAPSAIPSSYTPSSDQTTRSTSPSSFPSKLQSYSPTDRPTTESPSSSPIESPTVSPTKNPTTFPPSSSPGSKPSGAPSTKPSGRPTSEPFIPGHLIWRHRKLDIDISSGMTVRVIAKEGDQVEYRDGTKSKLRFHRDLDGAAVVPLDGGGYVYVSNSEKSDGEGGVYGVYFDDEGRVLDYKALLTGTSMNCSGGLTPWKTWISCEEYGNGQCWQVDPHPDGENHYNPMQTRLGGNGGEYESVACDNSNPERPVFYITEDHEYGKLTRFVADTSGWDSLNSGGKFSYLFILNDHEFEWTENENVGKHSASEFFQSSEGIDYHEGILYFITKKSKKMYALDLDALTYEVEDTGARLFGDGYFEAQPDQILRGLNNGYLYFTEDGGDRPGVYARDGEGNYYTIFKAASKETYNDDETVGIAFSPDGTRLYAGFQDAGLLMEFERKDGLPFDGVAMQLKYHGSYIAEESV